MVDKYPVLSETFVTTEVAELSKAGHTVTVETLMKADESDPQTPAAPVYYMTDEPITAKLRDAAWLTSKHPLLCSRDLLDRAGWRRQEVHVRPLRALAGRARRAASGGVDHLHVHFADESALDALRIGRILNVPYSVTAHAYDIFHTPRALKAKLDGAAFVTTGCEYNARHLRPYVADPENVHVLIMGVDPQRFRRSRPQPRDRVVLAVGRLVEKKGFAVLIEAAAELRRRDAVDRVVIVGDGPLRESLGALAVELDAGVEFTGALSGDAIRQQLEQAAVFAMPCVVARNGDRDSMPVVCKEALAMEVPVVASDEVGLPELIRPGWGRLVTPGNPEPLAIALAELLALDPARRASMGRAGREFVVARCNSRSETERLVALITTRVGRPAAQ